MPKQMLLVDPHGVGRGMKSGTSVGEWEITPADSGKAALSELGAAPFDALVTALRLPDVDGVELLRCAQEQHPAAVRILLAGSGEAQSALRAVRLAHQVLGSACDARHLCDTVDRTGKLQALITSELILKAVGGMETLPSVPRIHLELTQALGDSSASVGDVAAIVQQDAGMCAKIIQLVNSAYFGLPRRIANIEAAVNYLGVGLIKNLVLSLEVFQAFDRQALAKGFSYEKQQEHSMQVAALCRKMFSGPAAEDAFIAGMLHDAGKLILATRFAREYGQVLAAASESAQPVHLLEQEMLGVTHGQIGAYLLELWGLPAVIVEAAAFHHAPADVKHSEFEVVDAVHVADALAHEAAADGCAPALAMEHLARINASQKVEGWRSLALSELAANPTAPP